MRKLIVGVFVLILITSCSIVTIGTYKGYRLLQIASSMRSIQSQMEDATTGTDIHTVDIKVATKLLDEARNEAIALHDEVEPLLFLAPLLNWTPEFGPLMGDAEHYIELTDAVTNILGVLGPDIEQTLQIVQGNITDEETLPQLLQLLRSAEPKFDSIEDDIARAQLSYAAIENKASLPHQLRNYVPLLDRYVPLADELLDLARILPDIFAMEAPRTYLIVAQNEDSLRATGGVIRDIGIITVDGGDIKRINFESTLNSDTVGISASYGESFGPFAYFLNQPNMAFRDSNYWPDYAVSAEKMASLFEQSYPDRDPLAGIISVDQAFMQILVDGLGNLTVDNYGVITGPDVIPLLRRAQDSRGRDAVLGEDWWLYHEAVMNVLVEAAKDRVESSFDSLSMTYFSTSMLRAIDEQHLQIWFVADHEQALLRKLDWTNELIGSDSSDTVFVVDTNMGQNLANMVTDRSVSYEVALDWDGSADAVLDVQYDHTALYQVNSTDSVVCQQQPTFAATNATQFELLADQCYYNYLRIFTSPNSQIRQGSQHSISGDWLLRQTAWDNGAAIFVDDSGLNRIENFLVVPRGETIRSQYSYAIPGPILTEASNGNQRYTLTVLKQSGHKPEALTVHVTLPQGAQYIGAVPEPVSAETNRITFQFDQRSKVEVQVDFR